MTSIRPYEAYYLKQTLWSIQTELERDRDGTLADIMLCNSHCSGTRTGTGNLDVCLCVLNRDPNVPRGFVDIMLGNDVTFV